MKKYLIITVLFSFITALTFASPGSNMVNTVTAKITFVKAGPGQERDRDRRNRERRERRERRRHHDDHHGDEYQGDHH